MEAETILVHRQEDFKLQFFSMLQFWTKVPRLFNAEKKVFSTNDVGTTAQSHGNILHLTPVSHNTDKLI